jgi:hypothetical protein
LLSALEEAATCEVWMKKRCEQCGSKLGLGVRFLNLWNGQEWVHMRFCSNLCQSTYDLERRNETARNRLMNLLARDNRPARHMSSR